MSKLDTQLVVFKGGGYDGCIWEWNVLLFENGKLQAKQPIISGYAGKEAVQWVKDLGTFKGLRKLAKSYHEIELIIRTEEDWSVFCKDFNSGFVKNVSSVIGKCLFCDNCKGEFSPDEIYHTGYKGDGGIGIQYTNNLCMECADQEHDEYCAKHEWPHLSIKDRVESIQKYNKECGNRVSIFSARKEDNCPVPGSYICELQLY